MREPWYSDGLRFECTRCGACCSGRPGSVLVSDAEIAALAGHLELADHEFRAMYTRPLRKGDVSLREKRNRECVFWRAGSGCSVYAHRPKQCRTWPFWGSVVASEEAWREESKSCPGIGRGPLHAPEEIEQMAADDGTRGLRHTRE